MLSKLKSSLSSNLSTVISDTVYSTGNIISGVLPGNPVTRDYEVTGIDAFYMKYLAFKQVSCLHL